MGLKKDLINAQKALGGRRYPLDLVSPLSAALLKAHEGIFEALVILQKEDLDITPQQ